MDDEETRRGQPDEGLATRRGVRRSRREAGRCKAAARLRVVPSRGFQPRGSRPVPQNQLRIRLAALGKQP